MKLTADLISRSGQFINALRERELDLRGNFHFLSTFSPFFLWIYEALERKPIKHFFFFL